MKQYNIGLIGLGVMGANLARNMANNGHRVLGYNRTAQKAEDFVAQFGSEQLHAVANIEAFVQQLTTPHKIFLLVSAGNAVDQVIQSLLPHLTPGDMIIDGGNSHWPDTIRREQELKEKGLLFFGCGVSGGEEGALHGPSLMPGGDKQAYETHLAPILNSIAAKDFSDGACVTWIGEDGAGHYVKMVHNGIEYAVMQMLAETYDMLRKLYGLEPPAIADIFEQLHAGKLESFLTEISIQIFRKEDNEENSYLIDKILDKAGQKGTGKWTVLDAVERAVAVPSIAAAVDARVISSRKELRKELAEKISPSPSLEKRGTSPFFKGGLRGISAFTFLLEDALSASMLSAYAQGYDLIAQAAKEQNWSIDLAEVSRIWQGGCIIRARILEFLEKSFQQGAADAHLLTLPEVASEIIKTLPAMREVVTIGVEGGVALPALSSGLAYLENMRQSEGSANFIQGLRDFFGAHTFRRKDRNESESFHADWTS